MAGTLKSFLLLAVSTGCVAGGEGPRGGPSAPSDPDTEFPTGQADLFPGPIEAPRQIRIDSILEMRVGVRNTGTRSAGPGWMVRVFLSQDPVIDSADIVIDRFSVSRELPAGGEDQYLRHKKLRARTPLGSYYIGSILDVTSVVREAAEGNNALLNPATIHLTPEPPPDGW